MSLRHRPLRNAVLALPALLSAGLLWACGPFIHDWLLGSDDAVLATPTAVFRHEVQRLTSLEAPAGFALQAVKAGDEESLAQQTAAADLADVAEALAGLPVDRRDALLARYREVRDALRLHVDGPPGSTPAPAESPLEGVRIPEGLPAEIDLYLSGAVAYHRGDLGEARRRWQAVLDLPARDRRYRSTWAAFMLGKAALAERDFDAAVRWLERTRQIAAEKDMRDRLGLAAASLGWQARAELQRDRFAPALRLYADQVRTGDPGALVSLKTTAARALEAPPAALAEVARDDRARPFLTALVLSRTEGFYYEEDGARAEARKWLDAVENAGVERPEDAGRLAWAAYRAADFDAAGRWAEKAGAASPLGKWVRARLLLRDGRLTEGERLLAAVSRELPAVDLEDEAFSLAFEAGDPVATPWRAAGEAGAVALARGEYAPALEHFLAGGYWRDAAYVAERVLTADELRAYVDRRWPASLAAGFDPEAWIPSYPGLVPQPEAESAFRLRHLLARRLARLGRYAEADPYLPAGHREELARLAAGVDAGHDAGRPIAERAAGLFQAACLSRWYGLRLLATEIAPDWFQYDGQYDLGDTLEARTRREGGGRRFAASPDEAGRAARHVAEPGKRFHYRYTAADLGWQAAALLPDGSPEKARILAVAGSWLKDRDPEAADRFYRELVRCCGTTGLGREAARRKWLPPVEGCEPQGEE